MTESGPQRPTQLDPLLSEIYLRIRQGRFDEAAKRLDAAKNLAPEHPAVIELEGDLAFARNRFRQAEQCYKTALEADPKNAKLEEKYATAVLKVHVPAYLAQSIPDDSPWSNRVPRSPAASVLQSAILPGLGQLYNGDWLKGLIMLAITIMGGLAELRIVGNVMYAAKKTGTPMTFTDAFGALFSGPQVLLTLLLTALWVYAVIDAALVAKSMKS